MNFPIHLMHFSFQNVYHKPTKIIEQCNNHPTPKYLHLVTIGIWDLRLQPDNQSPYDLKLNFNNEWRFINNNNDISTISITLNGLPLIDTNHEMTVNNLQSAINLFIHLDRNGKKYTSYASIANNKQTVTEWISNNNLYDLRSYRISNGNKWNEYEPEYSAQALWSITFEFINDAILSHIHIIQTSTLINQIE